MTKNDNGTLMMECQKISVQFIDRVRKFCYDDPAPTGLVPFLKSAPDCRAASQKMPTAASGVPWITPCPTFKMCPLGPAASNSWFVASTIFCKQMLKG